MEKLAKKNKDGSIIDLGVPKFEIGDLVKTAGIDRYMYEDEAFEDFVNNSLKRYFQQDWGDVSKSDWHMNDEAVQTGERIHAAYCYPKAKTKIWIITEWDRSVTTILFPAEY